MNPYRHRLFFALVPPEPVLAQLQRVAGELQTRLDPGGRAVKPEQLHLTLAFLGEFAPEKEYAIADARAAAAKTSFEPFQFQLDHVASFPGSLPPWFFGVATPPAALVGLHGSLCRQLQRQGFVLERRSFVPHLTFLRKARRALSFIPVAPITWTVREFTLLDSRPAQHLYLPLGRWPATQREATPETGSQ